LATLGHWVTIILTIVFT